MDIDEVGVANMALSHIHIERISSVDEEDHPGAEEIKRFFWPTFREHMRRFDWPFARRVANAVPRLDVTPGEGFGIAYSYPVEAIRLYGFQRSHPQERHMPFKISVSEDGSFRYVSSNKSDARLVYSIQVPPSKWYEDYLMAFTHVLAGRVAVPLGGGGNNAVALQNEGERLLQQAMANAANEEGGDQWNVLGLEAEPDWMSGRGGGSYDLPPVVDPY